MMTGCNAPKKVSKPTHQETVSIDVNGAYTTKHDVALYLHTYHKLPKNFITKREARELGWQGGGLDGIKDGYCIGGDRYGNYEKHLPTRLVYSNNFDIYYTEDHYNTFIKVYSGEGQ